MGLWTGPDERNYGATVEWQHGRRGRNRVFVTTGEVFISRLDGPHEDLAEGQR